MTAEMMQKQQQDAIDRFTDRLATADELLYIDISEDHKIYQEEIRWAEIRHFTGGILLGILFTVLMVGILYAGGLL